MTKDSTPMTLPELIAALEKAEGPSRELDYQISDAAGIDRREFCEHPVEIASACGQYLVGQQCCGSPVEVEARPYTSSIDAALTLFADEAAAFRAVYEIMIEWATEGPTWKPTLWWLLKRLCIAALRARS